MIYLFDVPAVDDRPLIGSQYIEHQRIVRPGRAADAIAVIFHYEEHREFALRRKTHRFVKITLSRRRIAYARHHQILFSIELHAPRHSARRQKLRGSRSRHTPDIQVTEAVV